MTFQLSTTSQGIAISKKNHIDFIADFLSVIVNIGLCFLLIPVFELHGAAFANAISAMVLFGVNTYYGQKYYKTILGFQKTLIGLALLIFLLVFPSIVFDIRLIVLVAIAVDVLVFIIYKKEVYSVLDMLKSKLGK